MQTSNALIHAVSLARRESGLLYQLPTLRVRLPTVRLLFTHSTATGWAEGTCHLRCGDVQTWLPWDDPSGVSGFWRIFVRVGILMETEGLPQLV